MTEEEQKKIFSQNLKKYLNENRLNQNEVAKDIGVSPQTFNTWCKAKAIPRMGKIEKLANYFKIQKSDLIDQQTPTPQSINDIDFSHLTKEELEEVAEENHIPYTKIDYIDQPLYCSSPDVDMLEYEEHNTVIMSDNLLKGIKNKNRLMLAKATGDSMDEIIPDGSFVIIQRVEPYDNIQNHDIVLYNYENSLSIKEFIRDENGLIMRPHSTNPIHKDNIYSFENLKENPLFIIGIIKKVIYDI